MNFEFERELRSSYLKLKAEVDNEDFQMKMVENNRIPELLSLKPRRLNGKLEYLYDISSMICLSEQFGKNEMNFMDIKSLMDTLSHAVRIAEEYLLDINSIILDEEGVFYDTKSEKWRFVYFSENDVLFEDGMKVLSEFLIRKVNHKDNRAVTLAYGLYKRICEGNYDFENITEVETVKEDEPCEIVEEPSVVEQVVPELVNQEKEVTDNVKVYMAYSILGVLVIIIIYFALGIFIAPIRMWGLGSMVYALLAILSGVGIYFAYNWYVKNRQFFIKIVNEEIKIPYENKNVRIIIPEAKEDTSNYTVVLNDIKEKPGHYLKWTENNIERKYAVADSIVVIGSAADKSDCVIDIPGVSRMHARIICEDNKFYIKDLNSTNGTVVNSHELVCFEMYEIKSNDKISLGNAECVFV